MASSDRLRSGQASGTPSLHEVSGLSLVTPPFPSSARWLKGQGVVGVVDHLNACVQSQDTRSGRTSARCHPAPPPAVRGCAGSNLAPATGSAAVAGRQRPSGPEVPGAAKQARIRSTRSPPSLAALPTASPALPRARPWMPSCCRRSRQSAAAWMCCRLSSCRRSPATSRPAACAARSTATISSVTPCWPNSLCSTSSPTSAPRPSPAAASNSNARSRSLARSPGRAPAMRISCAAPGAGRRRSRAVRRASRSTARTAGSRRRRLQPTPSMLVDDRHQPVRRCPWTKQRRLVL